MKCPDCSNSVCFECGLCKCYEQWKDIWKEEPPRNEEILFMTGDREIYLGEIFSEEKLRKCQFHSFDRECDFDCDSSTHYDDRVIYWFPLPKIKCRDNHE